MLGMANPAQVIIDKFGGAAVVAKITNRDISRVHRWTYPQDKGGSGGIIPPKAQDMLIAAAPDYGVTLTRDEFFHPPPAQKKITTLQPTALPPDLSASKDICSTSRKSVRADKEAAAR